MSEIWTEFKPFKLYVKYANEYPYLPLAVADSKAELAMILGVSRNTVESSFSHGLNTFKEVDYVPDMWPDNDGGLWFYHPITHEQIIVRD